MSRFCSVRRPLTPWLALLIVWVSCPARAAIQGTSGVVPDFNRDIRPILSDHCFACHGPDEGKRKAGLRLDRREDAFKELKSGQRALVPGDLPRSSLVGRIRSTDPDEIMPPEKHGKPLSPRQIELLEQWVAAGALWKQHWSFLPPEHSPVPPVREGDWPRNELDYFILARMEEAGLKPNPEAERVPLIRRASFDLTGLPPTVEEVDAFLADNSPDAYEKLVERLLASPHYGERMAANWLDLARFADTSGYHFDGVRFMWLWRDWVIEAFNDNQPYDAFTVEQLAGDLLPNPSTDQRIATGFVRNNMTNDEGGADPDEYLNKYVVDRVNTLGAVWLGLTVGCTECHDHKYDPMTTREFYQLYAFFNNVPEKGLDRIRTDNPPPRLPVPSTEQAVRFVEADFRLKDAEKTLQDRINELGETQEKWERGVVSHPPQTTNLPTLAQISFDDDLKLRREGESMEGKWLGSEKPEFADGRLGRALKLEGKTSAEFAFPVLFDATNVLTLSAWVKFQGDGAIISQQEKAPGYRGFDLLLQDGRPQVHLVNHWPENALKVRTKEQFPKDQWLHVAVTYEGSRKASGLKLYVNGRARDVEVEKDQLSATLTNSEPIRVGSRSGEAWFTGLVDDVRLEERVLSADELRQRTLEGFLPLITKSRGHRTEAERLDLARFYKENHAVDYLRSEAALAKARSEKEALFGQIPTTLIMEEMDPPRPTFVLTRGDFRTPGEPVDASTPAFLPPLPEGPVNRLALARWLVSPQHPLTARVTVNRYWSLFFGTGLVKTINDFGSQGEWPSHPALLDWLAIRFREGSAPLNLAGRSSPAVAPWDVKALVRLIVTSATYRQSAEATAEKLERDPYNRLLARGPRLRLDAEFIRDNALAVSGLLNDQIGGPSVKPYQPPGLWDGTDSVFTQDHGDLLYRRGMYVFWRRSAHYPPMATFDAPNREVCTFLRPRTQTPLQSLVLMNDPGFVEAARALAQRVQREEPDNLDRRLVRAFRHTLGRAPEPEEIGILQRTYDEQLKNFRADPEAATALLQVGEYPSASLAPTPELAAMTTVANVLLNLNETISK